MSAKRQRGRPAGDAGDRKQSIALAAIELFGSLGYDNTSIRIIAEKAGVDAKLVSHYFGSKASLFAAVLKLPPQADGAMSILRKAPIATWGARIADVIVGNDGLVMIPQLIGVIKSASHDKDVASTVRDFYLKQSLEPALRELGIENSRVRASALSSLLAGFTFSDQILIIPAGSKTELEQRKKLVAELIQQVLTMELPTPQVQR